MTKAKAAANGGKHTNKRRSVQVTFKLRPDVHDVIEALRNEAPFKPEKTTVYNELLATHPKVRSRLRASAA